MPERLKVYKPPHRRGPQPAAAYRRVYQTPAWARLRAAALLRDEWVCQGCGKPLYGQDATCDHVIELQHGGQALPGLEGVQSLCRSCNSKKGRRGQLG